MNHVYETRFDWVRVYQKTGMSNTDGTVGVVDVVAEGNVTVGNAVGGIRVYAGTPAVVTVYDMSGREVASVMVSGSSYIKLPKGVYVVAGRKVVVL